MFDQMRGEGMKADTKTFCCLIRGYANAGVYNRMKDKQCRADETTFSMMAEAYKKEGTNDKVIWNRKNNL